MANVEKYELYGKPKPSFVNRSLTLKHSKSSEQPSSRLGGGDQSSLERASSMRKLYNSMESIMPTSNSFKGKVKKLCTLFESPKRSVLALDESISPKSSRLKPTSPTVDASIRLPGTEDRIVLYFTSLRGIRRTFEDCYSVRMIFRGFRVWVDERDVSMDLAYRKELQGVLGMKNAASLPQVFIGGKHVGGADVIKQMCETGELGKLLAKFPKMAPGFVCEYCGDMRFVPCTNCSGSRKVFDEDEGELKKCLECNENGLTRCPECCS